MHSPATTIPLKTRTASAAHRALWAWWPAVSHASYGWLHRRRVRATARILHALDDALLRDLALDRSEVQSVAAEVHGSASGQRRHARAVPPPRRSALRGLAPWLTASTLAGCIGSSWAPEPMTEPSSAVPASVPSPYQSLYPAPQVDPLAPPEEPPPTF
jgi:uncharacterized protein YjiS (DUF1127 family)